MAKLNSVPLFLLALVLPGCALMSGQTGSDVIDTEAIHKTDSTKQQRLALVGRWYRKQLTIDGGISEELTQMNADGSYLFEFRLSHNGEVSDKYFESGIWGVSGGYHFTFAFAEGPSKEKMWRVNPEDHRKYWVYKVLELGQANFRYQTVATGNTFALRRVAEDFQLQ